MVRVPGIIALFCFLFSAISLQALPISTDEAERTAINFYYERSQQIRPVSLDDISVMDIQRINDETGRVLIYACNMLPAGFVMVSADDASIPVIGYSFDGAFQPDNIPGNVQMWIDEYKFQIGFLKDNHIGPDEAIKAEWTRLSADDVTKLDVFTGRDVPPLITSKWDQGKYYNEMCPADPAGPGGHCVTGCVATCIGQIMNYFRWPVNGTGSYSYVCEPYGTLSADFENSTYEWDLMETSLLHSNLEVAEILNHIGISVDMVYGPDGSGMYNHKAAYCMKTFFKYSPETQYVFRDSTTMDWDSLLVTHLDRNIPLYYAGWSVPNINGHAFVCDGYQGAGYYHFNWGWGGSYDGYFYTNALNPGGSNFNLAQELVINAVPDTNLYVYPSYCQDTLAYTALYGTIDDGSGPLYPYQPGSNCSWLIQPYDSILNITIEFLNFNTDTEDSVSIYDGQDATAPLLGSFSGSTIPGDVISTGNQLFITFESDATGENAGFLARFYSEIPDYCTNMTTLTAETDTISDGSGTYQYHNNTSCGWMIMPDDAGIVTLYFTEFSTEADIDKVKIYDLETQELLAEYSGQYGSDVPPPVVSESGKMFIVFNTNSYVRDQGWTAFYQINAVGVSETREEAVGIYPNPAKDNITVFGTGRDEKTKVIIRDLAGREILSEEIIFQTTNRSFNISRIPPGTYILIVKSPHSTTSFKLIKID